MAPPPSVREAYDIQNEGNENLVYAKAPCSRETNMERKAGQHQSPRSLGHPGSLFCPSQARSLEKRGARESAPPFAIAVIGLGMIGSAAARHLSMAMAGCESGMAVLAIGPPEPTGPWASYEGPFASHYDEGRLTRISDPNRVWAELASRSIARYEALERDSGIRFHYRVGSLRVDNSLADLRATFEVGQCHGAVQEMSDDAEEMRAKFPYFGFEPGSQAVLVERGEAGYINPRRMVDAQLTLARRYGAHVMREAVKGIECIDGGNVVRIATEQGKTLWARKVLVCAGPYSSFLLHRGGSAEALDIRSYGRTVLMAEVEEEEEKRLAGMPSFIWRIPDNPVLSWAYGCPPTVYPDGRMILKLGGTERAPTDLSGREMDLLSWFRRNEDGPVCNVESEALEKVLLGRLMPGLRVRKLSTKSCAVSFTAHGLPYIDAVDRKHVLGTEEGMSGTRQVFVATGGCGAAAKSCDEIGRLAALMCLDKWPSHDFDPHIFRAIFVNKKDLVQRAGTSASECSQLT